MEEALFAEIKHNGLPIPAREAAIFPGRRFRLDFYWPTYRIAAEVHGGTYSRGRHVRGKGIRSDSEKINLLALMGIRYLQFTSCMINDGMAINTLKEVLKVAGSTC